MTKNKNFRKKKVLGSYPYLTVVLSMALALFVVGVLILTLFFGSQQVEKAQQVEIHVYLSSEISPAEIDKLQTVFKNQMYVKKDANGVAATHFYSSEQLAKQLESEYGMSTEEMVETAGFNPFKSCLAISIDQKFTDTKKLNQIKTQIEKMAQVYEVDLSLNKENDVRQLNENISTIRLVLTGIVLMSLLAIVFLINNTIKLALFSQRFLIRSMQLVGATKGFIMRPFIFRSVIHGLFSGVLASSFLYLFIDFLSTKAKLLSTLIETQSLFTVFLCLIFTGIIIGYFSTRFAINRYINISLDELY